MRLHFRAAAAVAGAFVWQRTKLSACSATAESPSAPASPPAGRLRRFDTSKTVYREGQPVELLYVPQMVQGVDLGHVTLRVDGSTLAFYGSNYRAGLSFVSADEGVIVSPCPLYAKAEADPALAPKIETLHRGTLSAAQAASLNEWASGLEISMIRDRERGVVRVPGVRYQALALCSNCENCATFMMRHFESEATLQCPRGMPRLCRPVSA
ncbi:hypothetical protein AB1Y20_006901 [Prymnesium parvum]|uniref:Phospholipid scramblase n=1 Tax=Prymnesium parvum TaxID=97485 RepID=A0AB34J160_PRYPA